MRILVGLFLLAHGVVHAIYVGHAARFFEVKPGITWPEGSWALSGLLGDSAVRSVVTVAFALVGAAFAVSAVGLILRQAWWQPVAASAAIVSSVVLALAWDGHVRNYDGQGAYALLINVAIVVCALVLEWPKIAE